MSGSRAIQLDQMLRQMDRSKFEKGKIYIMVVDTMTDKIHTLPATTDRKGFDMLISQLTNWLTTNQIRQAKNFV